ncbi:LacI family DNA-binding transcriptional regulator [Celeribacter sp.]|uniref:LacI family DNA-binding transcriptional regulator n=1 Tax=Celeribacter sp. TaxID=1890673 RepID=UPI003A8F96A2
MSGRITIKTLAQDLGISHMTVSRALSDSSNVKRETRELVRKRAAELGYVKSAAATAMRGDGTRIVGLIVPNLVNEFYARFANTLALLCEDSDLHLITHLTNDDPERELIAMRKLRELDASAFITVPAPAEGEADARLYQGMHTVQFIRKRALPFDTDSLVVQDTGAIKEAVHHLAAKGHKRISYFGAHAALSSGRQRQTAFIEAMEENALPVAPELIQTAAPTFEVGAACAQAVVSGEVNASAIVCGGFEISNGALDACLRAGISMPDDVAFVGYGDPSFYRWIQGGVTTIALPIDELAQKALELLSPTKSEGVAAQECAFKAELVYRATA